MELLEEPVIAPPIYEGKLRGELLVPKYNLTKEQKNELKKFREMIENNSEIQPLNEKQKEYIKDDACLLRYIRAREWNLQKAKELLIGTLKWLNSGFDLEDLINNFAEQLSHEGCTGKIYRNGKDKLGRPVIYMRDRNQNTKDYENQVRFTVYNLQMAIETMDLSKGIEQWILMIDFKGHSLKNAPPMKVSKQIL
jgi:hypothetical protein